ncbi:MAG TPA: outer membrane beta-barrel protein, partial [Acetobacteraceae bacterium]
WGQLFTDRANEPMLNQILVTLARPVDPKATGYEVGFKLQGMYGSDARYTHALGVFDRAINNRQQFDLVEANVQLHTPWLTEGGADFKAGIFPTPLGAETIDPSTNPFYTHSYIFSFGLPFKHTGVLATVHLTPVLDLYGGLDTGTNTSFGKYGDNNSALAGIVGFGLNNLLDGKLTVLALSHIGAENPSRLVPAANKYLRYYNDLVITYKPNGKLTLISEFNFARDDFARADAFGFAQYAGYALTDTLTLNARAELFRDARGFFVAAFPGVRDAARAQLGLPNTAISGTPTTYGSLTLGATYKPSLPAPLTGLLIRPELRYDHALTNNHPFNGGRDRGSFTAAADLVLGF